MSSHQPTPQPQGDKQDPRMPAHEEPGSNRAEHEPEPEPIPDGEHKYIRRSPYTTGND